MKEQGIHYSIRLDTDRLMADASRSRKAFDSIGRSAQESGTAIETAMSRAARSLSLLGAGFTAKELVTQVATVRGEFQKLEVAFNTMLGSEEKAAALMSQMVETAATTPFSLQDVASGAKQLLAYGTAAEDVNGTLIRLGDIAAGLSVPLNDLVYLYGTTMTQGRLYTADLNQFTGRGIPMIKELARQFGVAESQVRGLVEEGKVGFPEVEKVIRSLTDEGGMFGGLMEAQSKTISGQIANIGDSISMMFNEIGQSSEGIINTTLSGVSYLVENYEKVGEAVMTAATAYGAYKAALMAVAAYQNAVSGVRYSAEMAELSKLIPAKQEEARTDVEQAVASGRLTQAKAGQIAAMRAEAAEYVKSLQLKAQEAAAEQAAAMQAKIRADVAHKQSLIAVDDAMEQYEAALKSGDGLRIETAENALNSAEVEKNAAAKRLRSATSAYDTATTKAATASKAAETASVTMNTAAQTANATATNVLTAAKTRLLAVSRALGLSLLTNPYVLAAAAVTGLAYAIYKYATAATAAEAAQESFNRSMDKMAKDAEELKNKVAGLIRTIQDPNATGLQKALAYDELQKIAPAITEAYGSMEKLAMAGDGWNRQMNEMTDENKVTELERQADALQKIVSQMDKMRSTPSASPGSSADNEAASLRQRLKEEFDIGGSVYWNNSDWADAAQQRLNTITEELYRIKEARDAASAPTEIEVRMAESSYRDAKDKFTLLSDFAHAMRTEAERPMLPAVDGTQARRGTDDIIKEIESRLKAMDGIPLGVEQQQARDGLEEMLSYMKQWKERGTEQGVFTIPLFFQARMDSAETAMQEAEKQFNYITGKWEELEKKPKTYKEALSQARREWQAAAKEYERLRTSSTSTPEEVAKAKTTLDDKEKAYKDLGGVTGSQLAKQRRDAQKDAEEQKKTQEEIAKQMLALRRKNQEDEIALMEEGRKKELAQIQLKYEEELAEIDRQEKELAEKQGGTVTVEQRVVLSKSRENALATRNKSISDLDKEEEREEKERLQRLLDDYQDYVTKYKSTQDKFAKDRKDLVKAGASDAQLKELYYQEEEALKAIDNEFAAHEKTFNAWADSVTDLSLEKLRGLLNQASQELMNMEISDPDNPELAVKRAKVDKLRNAVSQKEIEKEVSPGKSVKDWDKLYEVLGEVNEVFGEIGDTVGGTLGGIISLAGEAASGSMQLAGAIKGVSAAVSGLEKASAILAAISAAMKIVSGISDFFKEQFGADYSGYEEMKAQYDTLIDVWDQLIDKKMEYISIDYGIEAQKAADEARSLVDTQIQRNRQLAQQLGASGASAGSHSLAYRVNDRMAAADWDRLTQLTGQRVSTLQDVLSLDASVIGNVLGDERFVSVLTEVDNRFIDYITAIGNYNDQLAEIEQREKEALTGVTFDDMRSSFKDALLNMRTDAEGFAEDLEGMLENAVAEALTSKFNDEIEQWYTKFSEYMSTDGKLEEWEAEDLRKQWENLVSSGREEWQNISDTLGLGENSTSTPAQTASSAVTVQASQESIDMLSGRALAIQETGLQIYNAMQEQAAKIDIGNVNLDAIRKNSAESRDIIESCYVVLGEIRDNTAAVVEPIRRIDTGIEEMKSILKEGLL